MATSKSVRAEAVLLLDAIASRRTARDYFALNFFSLANELDINNEALALARDCYDAVPSMLSLEQHKMEETEPHAYELECAQAALLMAEGWEQGDTIEEEQFGNGVNHIAADDAGLN